MQSLQALLRLFLIDNISYCLANPLVNQLVFIFDLLKHCLFFFLMLAGTLGLHSSIDSFRFIEESSIELR